MDNLEQKRCQNIKELNERGACHICGSTCRNSQGFANVLGEVVVNLRRWKGGFGW